MFPLSVSVAPLYGHQGTHACKNSSLQMGSSHGLHQNTCTPCCWKGKYRNPYSQWISGLYSTIIRGFSKQVGIEPARQFTARPKCALNVCAPTQGTLTTTDGHSVQVYAVWQPWYRRSGRESTDLVMTQPLARSPRTVLYTAGHIIGKYYQGRQNKLYWEVKERVGRR